MINEILDIYNNGIEVDRNTYTVQFYLGADWNFLAMAFGIDSAALGACTPHTTMGTIRLLFLYVADNLINLLILDLRLLD